MQAEALACLEGIQLANEWVNMPLILESDNASVIAELNATNVQVHEIKRDSNKIAHALAQLRRAEWVEVSEQREPPRLWRQPLPTIAVLPPLRPITPIHIWKQYEVHERYNDVKD
uniref:RNase H type-1 domain-containing protein n=1 Tax=Oryza barthii TaxID=65489 RepID=A0A0D3FKX1_9ORYZ